jgi:hypothetical protein
LSSSSIAQPIPQVLAYLVVLNIEYSMLIYVDCKYQYILEPSTISRYLHDRYKTPIVLQKQVDQYIRVFLYIYNYTSIRLPTDRSALQPIISVVDRFVYREYLYKTYNYSNIRKYTNQVYSKKHIADEDIYRVVQLQL